MDPTIINQAHTHLQHSTVRLTPTFTSESLNINTVDQSYQFFFKCEMFQRTGSFKFRGATNAVRNVPPGTQWVATTSSGNFGQALALAAKNQNLKCLVVMPNDTTSVKVDAVRGFGGEVVFCLPHQREETLQNELVNRRNKGIKIHHIHPSDDLFVIAGQGTIYREIVQQVKDKQTTLDVIVVPVGGGGVISGIALAAASATTSLNVNPGNKVLIVGAEPRVADDAYRSLQSHQIQSHRNNGQVPLTIAEGLKTTLGPNTFQIMSKHVSHIFLVDEVEIELTTKLLMSRLKVLVEPSSAVAYAATRTREFKIFMKENFEHLSQVNVGIVLTGGNVDVSSLKFTVGKL
jgi:threonine dehydratase